MKKLPIGIQTLKKIIEGDFVYVDKTKLALELMTEGQYYFLSRPRRFGKSLFLDTLKEIFEGNRELFKDLYIADKWDFEDKYPVLRISFGMGFSNRSAKELNQKIMWALEDAERDLGIKCSEDNAAKCFKHLIQESYKQYGKKVVILIDEYDKPILDNITNKEEARQIRDEMKSFYSTIKDNDAFIQFVFITGVSKFSKMSLFSGLNNLNDITLNPNYATICGYTHKDLETSFEEHLRGVDLEEVRRWYNGYYYFGEKVYNPFDILLFISNNHTYRNYWWSTGNPSFLVDILEEGNYYIPQLEEYIMTDELLDSFDVDYIRLEPLLWQTGYLTIKERHQESFGVSYKLGVPNMEVQTSLNGLFLNFLTSQTAEKVMTQRNLAHQLISADLHGFEQQLKSLFASIPYHSFTNNKIAEYEGYYASVVYAYLASLGFKTIAEDTTNRGRVDLSLHLEDKIYIFEFKVVEQATQNALAQIREKRYYEKYESQSKPIYLVGIEFGKEERNVLHFEYELRSI